MAATAIVAQYLLPGPASAGRAAPRAQAGANGFRRASDNKVDSETTLVERCLGGDAAAWELMVRTHTRRVYALCYRFTNRDSEAQDLTRRSFSGSSGL